MDRVGQIIQCIRKTSGRYSEYEVFNDWIKCSAIAVSNSLQLIQDKVWKQRENEYMQTMLKYDLEERKDFVKMTCLLADELDENPSDVLGKIFMQAKMGSSATGQFFTPYHICQLCATALMGRIEPDEQGLYKFSEPSCGGGAMIIAAAMELKKNGINYQKKMRVVAQDLDWNGVYMCYLQLSFLGIHAICVQGDSMSNPFPSKNIDRSKLMFTPQYMGVLL